MIEIPYSKDSPWLKDRLRLSDTSKELLKKILASAMYKDPKPQLGRYKKEIDDILLAVATECAEDEASIRGQRYLYNEEGIPYLYCLNCENKRNECKCY